MGGGEPLYIIGKHSYCAASYIEKGTKIGNFCSIAFGVHIHPSEHNFIGISTSPYIPGHIWDKSIGHSKGCIIGSDVWIGLNSIILQSCKKIGHGAIVAAGAVVTKDIPNFAIVAGVPARVVKYRFSKEICKKLLSSQWWNLPDDTLEKLSVNDIRKFLNEVKHL